MGDNYSLNGFDSVSVSGGGLNEMFGPSVYNFADKWIGRNPVFWAIVIVIMIIVIASLSGAISSLKSSLSGKQSFMPTATMWAASQDQANVGGSRTQNFYPMRGAQAAHAYAGMGEHIDPTSTTPVPMASGSSQGSAANYTPAAGPDALANSPSAYTNSQILSSSEFNCATRVPVGSDAWSWMTTQAESYMTGPNKPIGDNQFSQILSGH